MKKIKPIFYLIVAISVVLSSCTIDKRLHNSGYHITWKNQQQVSESSERETLTSKAKETTETIAFVPSNVINQDDKVNSIESESSRETTGNVYQPSVSSEKKNLPNPLEATKSLQSNEKITPSFKNRVFKQGEKMPLQHSRQGGDVPFIVLLILCFLLPFVAVGLRTNWNKKKFLISLILTIFFWIPGVIYALWVVLN